VETLKPEPLRSCLAVILLAAASCAHAGNRPSHEEPIVLDTPTGKISGTVLLPEASGRLPVALIIAGSGPTDRDGNSPILKRPNNSLKMLAQVLADAGYASVRYDKRGVGASLAAGPSEAELRFDGYVDDAAAWVRMLGADPRFSSVAVIGHSEGALIGMLAAQKSKVSAFISIAGAAQNAADILRQQLEGKLPAQLAEENEQILASLQRGETSGPVSPALNALYRPSVQPYLVSLFKYVPSSRIGMLDVPVLIVQGTTDIQVSVAEATALKKAKPSAVLAVIPGMNHMLKMVPADMALQLSSYSDPTLPIAPQLTSAIVDFLGSLRLQ
jgi:pimeloyl-ACP methyl ester carboxylesterase